MFIQISLQYGSLLCRPRNGDRSYISIAMCNEDLSMRRLGTTRFILHDSILFKCTIRGKDDLPTLARPEFNEVYRALCTFTITEAKFISPPRDVNSIATARGLYFGGWREIIMMEQDQ